MRGSDSGPGDAEALHVCFPSGWDPREKAGRDFTTIHEPVGDNARLLGASANVMKALLTKGPYVRFSFGLSPNPALDNHPVTRPPKPPASIWTDPESAIDRIYVRMERQTTYPMPDLNRGLFTSASTSTRSKHASLAIHRSARASPASSKPPSPKSATTKASRRCPLFCWNGWRLLASQAEG